jgi:uncharacterized protein
LTGEIEGETTGAAATTSKPMSDDAEDPSPAIEPEKRSRVDPRLLEILVCPVTRAPLSYDAARQELISRAARLAYPIRDGVPIMLPEEARRLDD